MEDSSVAHSLVAQCGGHAETYEQAYEIRLNFEGWAQREALIRNIP